MAKSSPLKKKPRRKQSSSVGTNRNGAHARERTPAQIIRQGLVYDLHISGCSYRQIVARLTTAMNGEPARYPTLNLKTVMSDIEYARDERREAQGKDLLKHIEDACAFYEKVKLKAIAAPAASRWVAEGIKAQQAIDKIRGLNAPVKIAGHDGGAIKIKNEFEAPMEGESSEIIRQIVSQLASEATG